MFVSYSNCPFLQPHKLEVSPLSNHFVDEALIQLIPLQNSDLTFGVMPNVRSELAH